MAICARSTDKIKWKTCSRSNFAASVPDRQVNPTKVKLTTNISEDKLDEIG